MTTREKILKVLTFKGISLYEATRQMGLGAVRNLIMAFKNTVNE